MCWTGVTTPDALREKRPYVIVGVFVLGMLLTPPDIISQTLLAIPMWILFEFGVVIGGIYTRKKADQEQQDNL
jgi:sec-independent protein translocase protein TatC